MSKQISTLDLLVELTTEEQQLLSGGQEGSPDQPPIDNGNDDGNDGTEQNNRINRINRLSIPFLLSNNRK